MPSEEQEKLIARYNDPDLTEPERARLDQVLQENTGLVGVLEQYRRIDEALAHLPDGLEKVDFTEFSRRVGAAVAAAKTPGLSTLWFRRHRGWLAAAAAIIIVALPIFLLLDRQPPPPVGEFVAVVELAQPQTLFTQARVNNIGGIIPPQADLGKNIMSQEESAVGVVWSSPGRSDRSEQRSPTQITGIFDIFLDGSS